jgi:hypothetical protein
MGNKVCSLVERAFENVYFHVKPRENASDAEGYSRGKDAIKHQILASDKNSV